MKRTAAEVIAAWREGKLNNDDGELASAINYWVWTEWMPDFDRQNQAVREALEELIVRAKQRFETFGGPMMEQAIEKAEAALQVAGAQKEGKP